MTTLAELGEDRLVAELTRNFRDVGDDCAVVSSGVAGRWQLLKTDAVVESVHFLSTDDPRAVGWKALVRPLSDIAAMSGLPAHALVTIAARPDLRVDYVKKIYPGFSDAASRVR